MKTARVIQVTYALRPQDSAKLPQHSKIPGATSEREKMNTWRGGEVCGSPSDSDQLKLIYH